VNNINDQIYATITILLIFESAQHVSGIFCPSSRGPECEGLVYAAAPRTSILL